MSAGPWQLLFPWRTQASAPQAAAVSPGSHPWKYWNPTWKYFQGCLIRRLPKTFHVELQQVSVLTQSRRFLSLPLSGHTCWVPRVPFWEDVPCIFNVNSMCRWASTSPRILPVTSARREFNYTLFSAREQSNEGMTLLSMPVMTSHPGSTPAGVSVSAPSTFI